MGGGAGVFRKYISPDLFSYRTLRGWEGRPRTSTRFYVESLENQIIGSRWEAVWLNFN